MLSRIATRSTRILSLSSLIYPLTFRTPSRQSRVYQSPLLKKFSTTVQQRNVFAPLDTFARRHNGSVEGDIEAMLEVVGVKDMDELVTKTIPSNIRSTRRLQLDNGLTESELLERLKAIASKNKVYKSYIGMGYADTIIPTVILRNVLESPGWYTQVCMQGV